MSRPFDVSKQLAAFTGRAPLFPLPDVVHFPHLLLPLHIFENRYREMVADSLESDRFLAMALLKPGWTTTEGSPPIYETVCLGHITADQKVPDGRYHLVLQGLSRARLVTEEPMNLSYRIARLDLFPDDESETAPAVADAQRQRLLRAFRQLYPRHELESIFRQAIDEAVPVGLLCDVLADAMSLDPLIAQQVLAELDVGRRCRLVLRLIHQKLRRRAKAVCAGWPPQFSLN